MTRFYCETHEITHTEGECPVCSTVEVFRRDENKAAEQLRSMIRNSARAEREIVSAMQEQDRQRVLRAAG